MANETFIRRSRIAASAHEVFAWHERTGAFQRLTPAWEPVRLVEHRGGIRDGARVVVETRVGPVGLQWELEHRDYIADQQFCDVQLHGPFSHWRHLHRIEADGPAACYLEDRIEYALPLAPLGPMMGGGFVRHKLERLFEFRHRVTIDDLQTHLRATRGRQP